MAENAHCVSVVMTIAPWLDTRQAHTGTKRQSDPSVPEAPQPRSARLPVLSCQPTEAAAKPAGAVLRIPPSAGRVGAEPALAASVRHGFPLPGENRPSRSAGGRHAGLHTIVGSRHALGRATRRQFKMGKSHGPDASTTRSAPPEPRKTAPASPVASPSPDAPQNARCVGIVEIASNCRRHSPGSQRRCRTERPGRRGRYFTHSKLVAIRKVLFGIDLRIAIRGSRCGVRPASGWFREPNGIKMIQKM